MFHVSDDHTISGLRNLFSADGFTELVFVRDPGATRPEITLRKF